MVQGGHLAVVFPFLVTILFIAEQTFSHHSVESANYSVDCVFGFCSTIVQNQNLLGLNQLYSPPSELLVMVFAMSE
jgi:hypothetical protein